MAPDEKGRSARHMDENDLNALIGRIYDCAVDPAQWVGTLTEIRDRLDLAFVSLNHFDFTPMLHGTGPPDLQMFTTDWDPAWHAGLAEMVNLIPEIDRMRVADIDTPVRQLDLIDEAAFRQTEFYARFVEPWGMLDNASMNVIKRPNVNAMLAAATYATRRPYDAGDMRLLSLLSPHIRRAMLIADMMEEKSAWVRIYERMLDGIGVPVMLVGRDGRLMYHNAPADALLSEGRAITLRAGRLMPQSTAHAQAFYAAIDRACTTRDIDLGHWGAGVPLPPGPGADVDDGDGDGDGMAVAYVLPMGTSDLRRQLGPGLAAIFFATSAAGRPPSVEVISALSGLTTAEARVALAVAEGQGTAQIAQALGITIQTLRKHLANIYDKSGLRSQTALAAFVNRLNLPSADGPANLSGPPARA